MREATGSRAVACMAIWAGCRGAPRAVGGAAAGSARRGLGERLSPNPDERRSSMSWRSTIEGVAGVRGRGSRAVACAAARAAVGRVRGAVAGAVGRAGRAGWRGRCEGGGGGYRPFEPRPSRRSGRAGSVAWRGTRAASGRRPSTGHVEQVGKGCKNAAEAMIVRPHPWCKLEWAAEVRAWSGCRTPHPLRGPHWRPGTY